MKMKSISAYLFALTFFFSSFSIASAQLSEETLHIPGIAEGIGNSFEIVDSEYLNITINSSENIEARIESAPEIIVIDVKTSEDVSSAEITISGLPQSTIFHKYQDDYHNYSPLISNENGEAFFDLDLKENHIIFIQPRKSTKFIKDNETGGDCESIGSWNASNKTCTLNQDVNETIQIDSDGITLDGNDHVVSGTGTGSGIYSYNKKEVVIKNIIVTGFYYGISFRASSSYNEIKHSILKNNSDGIYMQYAGRNTISENNISENSNSGINFYYATKNTILNNVISNNKYGILQSWQNYYKSVSNNTYENNDVSGNFGSGIYIYGGNGDVLNENRVKNNTSYGINITESSYCVLRDNMMMDNGSYNFYAVGNDLNTHDINTSNKVEGKSIYYIKDVNGESFDGVEDAGIFYCINCNNISLKNFSLSENNAQIFLDNSNNSLIENVSSPDENIEINLNDSSGNTIKKNTFGFISFSRSDNNLVFNNNFMSDRSSAYINFSEGNLFNLELPIGGNYWKRHERSCHDNNEDGICDSPYKFSYYADDADNYPWAKKFNIISDTSGNPNILFLPGIKASKLYKDGILGTEDQLWPPNFFGSDLEDLALNENGESINEIYTRDILESAGGNIYKTFIEKMKSLKSDGTINDFNSFAYDWRKSVEDVAQNGTLYDDGEIKSAIAEIENLSNSAQNKKVTIIAHSNGGLLAKAVMMKLEELEKADKIDKIIFVGVPQMGTPLSILSLLYGYDESLIMGMLVSQSEARKLGENMLGAYGLLPSQKYFERMEEPFINFLFGKYQV